MILNLTLNEFVEFQRNRIAMKQNIPVTEVENLPRNIIYHYFDSDLPGDVIIDYGEDIDDILFTQDEIEEMVDQIKKENE